MFLNRNKYQDHTQKWKSIRKINFQIKENVRHWMKKIMKKKKRQMHAVNKDFNEKKKDNDALNIKWWQSAFDFSFEEYENEHIWNYWKRKEIAIDLQTLMKRKNTYLKIFMISRLKVDESYDLWILTSLFATDTTCLKI